MKAEGDAESMVHFLIFVFAAIIIVAVLVWYAVTKLRILG
jgi:hypothetical protein